MFVANLLVESASEILCPMKLSTSRSGLPPPLSLAGACGLVSLTSHTRALLWAGASVHIGSNVAGVWGWGRGGNPAGGRVSVHDTPPLQAGSAVVVPVPCVCSAVPVRVSVAVDCWLNQRVFENIGELGGTGTGIFITTPFGHRLAEKYSLNPSKLMVEYCKNDLVNMDGEKLHMVCERMLRDDNEYEKYKIGRYFGGEQDER